MNPQEIPQVYDVSKVEDLGRLSQSLTPFERKALQESFIQEKAAIIHLTQSELWELENILTSENNHHSDRIERVIDFVEKQKREGLSLTDITEGLEEIPEELAKQIESLAQEKLFWANGLMNGIDLSQSAKSNISTSFWLSILEKIGRWGGIAETDLAWLMESTDAKLSLVAEALQGIGELRPWQRLKDLHIRGFWEENHLFMNIWEGQTFFREVFDGKLESSEKIIEYITNKNLKDWEVVETLSPKDILKLRKSVKENVNDASSNLATITDPETRKTVWDMAPEEKRSLIERLKESDSIVLQILAGLLEFMKEIGGEKTWKEVGRWETKTNTEEENEARTEEVAAIDLKGKKISLTQTWVHDQIRKSVNDIQKPSIKEIQNILEEYKNRDFSQVNSLPENSAQAIYALQVALSSVGIDAWVIDGIYGPATEAWIEAYRKNLWLEPDKKIDSTLFESLLGRISLQDKEK